MASQLQTKIKSVKIRSGRGEWHAQLGNPRSLLVNYDSDSNKITQKVLLTMKLELAEIKSEDSTIDDTDDNSSSTPSTYGQNRTQTTVSSSVFQTTT